MHSNIIGKKDGYLIRLARKDNPTKYYEENYCPLDGEVVRLTGSKEEYSKDEILLEKL